MRFTALVLLAAFAPLPEDAAPVREFYKAYAALHVSGLPNPKQMEALAPRLSKPLAAALKRASTEQARCRKAHSDEKPPWVEGDLFSSNFEGFTRFEVASASSAADRMTAIVAFEYAEGGHTVKWKDEAVFVREQGRWVLDDMRFQMHGKPGHSLREGLAGQGCD